MTNSPSRESWEEDIRFEVARLAKLNDPPNIVIAQERVIRIVDELLLSKDAELKEQAETYKSVVGGHMELISEMAQEKTQLRQEIEKMKKEKQIAQATTLKTEIDDTLVEVYNQALDDVLKLINKGI